MSRATRITSTYAGLMISGVAILSLGGLNGVTWAAAPATAEVTVANGMKVTMEYTLTLPDNSVTDSTVGKAPFTYTHGSKDIVFGLEEAVTGMKVGERKVVTVPPIKGYGVYVEKLKSTVKRNRVPKDLKVGAVLKGRNGKAAKVIEIKDDTVLLDMNHPLAGKTLMFDVRILKIEPAPPAASPDKAAAKTAQPADAKKAPETSSSKPSAKKP